MKTIMDSLRRLIGAKPPLFVIISLVYLVLVAMGKWMFAPAWDMVWFVGGGIVGVYALDAAEIFFALSPSPFRSVIFLALYVVVSAFVLSSSGNAFASGLVLSLYVQLLLWQVGEWQISKNLSGWYRMVAGSVSIQSQRLVLIAFGVGLLVATYIFIRS